MRSFDPESQIGQRVVKIVLQKMADRWTASFSKKSGTTDSSLHVSHLLKYRARMTGSSIGLRLMEEIADIRLALDYQRLLKIATFSRVRLVEQEVFPRFA